jgi:hypothetical protein
VTYKTYADSGNTLFATTTPLTSQTFTVEPFSGTQTTSINEAFPYSLSEEVIVTQTGAGQVSFDANLSPVPDGGMTVLLLGSSLMVLGFIGRACKNVRA